MSVKINTICSDDFGIVTCGEILGDLDHHSAKEIRMTIDREINEKHTRILILDFSKVTFMDSSGIGLVMGRYKIMENMNGKVIVACPPPYIKKVMKLSGINMLTEIVEDYSCYMKCEKNKEDEKVEEHSN